MTTVRRALLLLGLVTAVVLGPLGPAAAPAGAALADSASVTTTISTATVAPVTNLVGNLVCSTPSTMSATWTRSTSARVSGYTVKVHFSDGFVQSVELPATATSWSATIDKYYVTAYSIQYSVTTKTDYGWTTESAKTSSFRC
ncbi:hypothetical protein [Blastococcus sp. PRF04-17]|uniref:hypothetical protein n=1 Tax=Blastococcus sp. PRF04-17 TaxID=2933797 RepID=UPI001FF27AFC|nr:hypothetical protein [Blastococcus sp. PRF04-17]UOY03574.1 hypothetical protein MVA48_09700 [Blastococcus sp. PRF04-17]